MNIKSRLGLAVLCAAAICPTVDAGQVLSRPEIIHEAFERISGHAGPFGLIQTPEIEQEARRLRHMKGLPKRLLNKLDGSLRSASYLYPLAEAIRVAAAANGSTNGHITEMQLRGAQAEILRLGHIVSNYAPLLTFLTEQEAHDAQGAISERHRKILTALNRLVWTFGRYRPDGESPETAQSALLKTAVSLAEDNEWRWQQGGAPRGLVWTINRETGGLTAWARAKEDSPEPLVATELARPAEMVVRMTRLSRNGRILAGADTNKIVAWKLATGRLLGLLNLPNGPIPIMDLDRDGQQLAFSRRGAKAVELYDVSGETAARKDRIEYSCRIYSVHFDDRGRLDVRCLR